RAHRGPRCSAGQAPWVRTAGTARSELALLALSIARFPLLPTRTFCRVHFAATRYWQLANPQFRVYLAGGQQLKLTISQPRIQQVAQGLTTRKTAMPDFSLHPLDLF